MYDELELDKLGDRKTALFLIMSDTDSTFNFLISMIYTQLFNLLCDKADDQYGGKLPVHVRCLIDECANIGQIPQLEKLAEVLDFDVDRLFVENNQSTVFTAFRGSKLSDEERAGAEHLMEMMLAARQQIMLRKALHHE